MARLGERLCAEARRIISERTRAAMWRPEVRECFLASLTPERQEKITSFHKKDALRPERVAISIANLPKEVGKEKNGNWRGGRYKECIVCGNPFWALPCNESTARYCSKSCQQEAIGFKEGQVPHNRLRPNLLPTPTLAYILGVVMGDGSIVVSPPRYEVRLQTTQHDFNLAFAATLQEIGLHPKTYGWRNTSITYAFSKAIVEWLKQVDRSAFLTTNSLRAAFVRGFYESEGGCYHTGYSWQIVMSNTNRDLIDLVQCCLQELGYNFHLRSHQPGNGRKVLFMLHKATKSEVERFFKEINPCIKRGPFMAVKSC